MKFYINADDFGRTETVNEAIDFGMKNGYLSSTTIMLNMPCYKEAIKLAKEGGYFDKVGLHLNVINGPSFSEKIKKCKRFTDSYGYFTGQLLKDKKMMFFLTRKEKLALKEEIDAQIERYLAEGFTSKRVDTHGLTNSLFSTYKIFNKEFKKYGFTNVRIARNLKVKSNFSKIIKKHINKRINNLNKEKFIFFGSFKDYFDILPKLKDQDGLCEIMLHPNVWKEYGMAIGEGLEYGVVDERIDKGNIV